MMVKWEDIQEGDHLRVITPHWRRDGVVTEVQSTFIWLHTPGHHWHLIRSEQASYTIMRLTGKVGE